MKLDYINRMFNTPVDITFMVPCLNEETRVGPTLELLIDICQQKKLNFEVLVFDDASTDGSVAEIKGIQAKYPKEKIILIENKKRRGLARNYVDGAYIGSGNYYMCVMGDNPQPRESLAAIINEMGKVDIVVPVWGDQDNRTRTRKLISRAFTWLVNICSGYKLGYYNGIALHRRFNVMRWHSDTDGFAYQAEIIVRLLQEGCTYKEVEIVNNDRPGGVSTALNFKNFLSVGHGVFQIFLRRLRHILFKKGIEEKGGNVNRMPASICTYPKDSMPVGYDAPQLSKFEGEGYVQPNPGFQVESVSKVDQ